MTKLSILLASYGSQSQRYLDLCLKSLEAQTFKDFDIHHVSSGEFRPDMTKNNVIGSDHFNFSNHYDKRMHFPEAIKTAYENSEGSFESSDYILLLNDDVILQKDCLFQMVDLLKHAPNFIINPRSNCDDNGRFYWTLSSNPNLQYRIEEMEQMCDSVIQSHQTFPFCCLIQHQVHFYCTIMTRKCWEDVGGIDVNLKTGFDDADFCLRAKQKGYVPIVAMHAYALHGSGVSADIHLTDEDRAFNEKYFQEKHS